MRLHTRLLRRLHSRTGHQSACVCVGLILVGTSLALPGCYEEIEPRAASSDGDGDTATDTAATQPADGESEAPRAYGNSQSTLGKARDTAKGTIADLEARDRELQKQIDDQ